MATSIWRPMRPEDPQRLRRFKERVHGLRWTHEDMASSMSVLFEAVDELAQAEVDYYYRRRGTRAWISGVSRLGAWLLGSAGLMLPLLAAADAATFGSWSPFGYALLAAAASCLAANALFGGTDGHVRFVSTQLKLESLMTSYRVRWCQYLGAAGEGRSSAALKVDQGFALIHSYAADLHSLTVAETGQWGEVVMAELASFKEVIDKKASRPAAES